MALQVGVVALAAAAGLVRARERTVAQVGALSGAILIGLQLVAIHWFFFYVVWFVPGVLLALLVPVRSSGAPSRGAVPGIEDLPLSLSATIARNQ
ncbi:MAG: hypothetical protein E6G07_10010 [Actinobacteria bacterium]|nr:MAG: hypothetical protein E6G07_10010 [Actinomycetota bacterium]